MLGGDWDVLLKFCYYGVDGAPPARRRGFALDPLLISDNTGKHLPLGKGHSLIPTRKFFENLCLGGLLIFNFLFKGNLFVTCLTSSTFQLKEIKWVNRTIMFSEN